MISIWNIKFEIDGELYTTKWGFDHSKICDCVSIDDLVKLKDL